MKRILNFVVLFIVLLTGCEKSIEVDYSQFDFNQKIVVQAYLSNDGIDAYINKALPLGDIHGNTYLESPDVWLYENDLPFAQLYEQDSSYYVLEKNIKISKDNNYKLEVSASGFDTAVSNISSVIEKVTIDNVFLEYDSTSMYSKNKIHIEFTDNNPEMQNTYLIWIHSYSDKKENSDFSFGGVLDDRDYETNSRSYVAHSPCAFDSTIVEITTYSDIISNFDDSYDNTIGSGDIISGIIYPVESYVKNGYGFFGAREVTKYCYVPDGLGVVIKE